MELTPLRSFVAVARERHLTRAARSLGLTQPAVSGQLSRLEAELGTALFHRTPKGMELTEAGQVFLTHVERLLVDLDDGIAAVEELKGVQRGTLAIGGGATATTYLLPPLFRRFHEQYPGIRLYVREAGSKAVIDAVAAGELDLGVITVPDEPLPAPLSLKPWVDDELVLIVPPAHALAGRRQFRFAELEGLPLVMFEAGSAVRARIDGALHRAGVRPEIVMELRSLESIQQMVAQGIGAAFVSRFALEDVSMGLTPRTGAAALRRVRDDLGDCRRCALASGRRSIVFGVGDPDADLVVIGEAPGYHEDQQGEPFVGAAGQMLDKMIENVLGLSRQQHVYILNMVKCRPPRNRDPEPAEIEACRPFLEGQLQAIRPKVMLVLGRVALQALFLTNDRITRARGRWRTYHDIPVMPTFHPAYLLRNPADKRKTFDDLKALKERYDSLGGRRVGGMG